MAARRILRMFPLLSLVWMAGCLQIDTRVKLHEDGSATITERLQFSRRLLDLDAQREVSERRYEKMLAKEGALNRMKMMGTGITLVSHTVQEGSKGALQSVTVYKIPDLADFRYMSPWLAYLDYADNNGFQFHLTPETQYAPGLLAIDLKTLKPPKRQPAHQKGESTPPLPKKMQIYRELSPIFRDVLKDFRIKLVFEAYCPLTKVWFGYRGQDAKANHLEIIDFSTENLDNYGGKFLENEELMLDLVRGDLRSPNIVEHVKNFVKNRTLPVFVPYGSGHMWGSRPRIWLQPSMQLFKKYVEGKVFDFGTQNGGKRKATFDEVGYNSLAPVPKK